jgi:hypothetical protein
MNVTLNLMAEFEDIPRELSHMLKYVEEELNFASRRAANIATKMNADDNDNQESMDLLHSVRLHMAKIDQRMEDCMSILAGYSHYLENPPEETPEETPEEANDEG